MTSIRKMAIDLSDNALKEIAGIIKSTEKNLPQNALNEMLIGQPTSSIYGMASKYKMSPKQLQETIEIMSENELMPSLKKTKFLGIIPGLEKKINATQSGYLRRVAEELGEYSAKRTRNKKLLIGAGLAGALGVIGHSIFSDNPEDKYEREVKKLMNTSQLLR